MACWLVRKNTHPEAPRHLQADQPLNEMLFDGLLLVLHVNFLARPDVEKGCDTLLLALGVVVSEDENLWPYPFLRIFAMQVA